LARRRSLAALLFRLERPLETEELKGLLGEVSGWFRQHPEQERLRHLFAELIRQAYKEHGEKPPASYDWLEMKMKSNFPTTVKNWKQQALAEGRAEGRAEGIAQGRSEGEARGRIEGKVEGKAEDLVHLLVARFGALAPSLRTRIRRARLATLERWFKRAIAASDLRSVFNSPR
jgi:flagellar biosynthesis/type III secretory pathway protein FliH